MNLSGQTKQTLILVFSFLCVGLFVCVLCYTLVWLISEFLINSLNVIFNRK